MGIGNLVNLYRIQKLYSLLRNAKDNPKLLNDIKWWKEVGNTALSIKEIQEMGFLKGYKTYIIAGLVAILAGLKAMGYIDEATYKTLLALLSAGGLATVASKINNVQKEIKLNEEKRVLTDLIARRAPVDNPFQRNA